MATRFSLLPALSLALQPPVVDTALQYPLWKQSNPGQQIRIPAA